MICGGGSELECRKYRLPRFRRHRIDPLDRAAMIEDHYIPTPEDFLPSPPKPRSRLAAFPELSAAKPAILGFLLFWVVSLHDWQLPRSEGLWASGETVFQRHEYWRLVTALFDHADIGHLLSNSPLFLIFGWYLCAFFGWFSFPIVALVVGVLSNALTIYCYPPGESLLGASGMCYGMVALWVVLYVRYETAYSVGNRLMRAIGVSLLLLFPTTFEASTSYLAHLFGFLVGLVAGFAVAPGMGVAVPIAPLQAGLPVDADCKRN